MTLEILDKHIHETELRLRILLTNDCDQNCHHCLNDFQSKGNKYIDSNFIYKVLSDYNTLAYLAGIQAIVSFSGGEPGLHPCFPEIIDHVKQYDTFKIQVNTNGKIDERIWNSDDIDIRYHIGEHLNSKPNFWHKGHKAVFVITDEMNVPYIVNYLYPFYEAGMEIKTFVDYYGSKRLKEYHYPLILKEISRYFPASGRFTGIQENRGNGCLGCTKECVTLKALWLFPDNTSSPCPQIKGEKYTKNSLINAYEFHYKKV